MPKIIVKKHSVVGFSLVLIPLALSFLLIMPHHYHFTTTGDVVSVRQLGIQGNVFFAYVRSGYAHNLYEKLSLMQLYKRDIQFEEEDGFDAAEQKDEKEFEATLRDNTIKNAVNVASKGASLTESGTNEKMNEIMKKSERYYGDSFGLMVAIGLKEEWDKEDYSQNGRYKIAGTGTMTRNMRVGPVGGVKYKVIAAEKKGMHYFLIPNDSRKSLETGLTNKEEAEQAIKQRNMKIKLVPVSTLEDAVTFLKALH